MRYDRPIPLWSLFALPFIVGCDAPTQPDTPLDGVARIDVTVGEAVAMPEEQARAVALKALPLVGAESGVPIEGRIIYAGTNVTLDSRSGSNGISSLTIASPPADHFLHQVRWTITIGTFSDEGATSAEWGSRHPGFNFIERGSFGSNVPISIRGSGAVSAGARTAHTATWVPDATGGFFDGQSHSRWSYGSAYRSGNEGQAGPGNSGATSRGECAWYDVYVDGSYQGRYWVCM